MTGEMSWIKEDGMDANGNYWPIHAAIAKAVGGELKPFDVYQGPYIQTGKGKLWLQSDGSQQCLSLIRHGGIRALLTDSISFPFGYGIESIVDTAKVLLSDEFESRADGSLFVRKLKDAGYNDHAIEEIQRIIDSVCRHCWDGPIGCNCWRDE